MDAVLPFVFVALALAMIVGPVMLMRPNNAQTRIAKVRQQALSFGLKVFIGEVRDKDGRALANYLLPVDEDSEAALAEWMLVKKGFSHGAHAHGFWDWSSAEMDANLVLPDRVTTLLDEAPDGIYAVGSGRFGVFAAWNERYKGEDPTASLDALKAWLRAWQRAHVGS